MYDTPSSSPQSQPTGTDVEINPSSSIDLRKLREKINSIKDFNNFKFNEFDIELYKIKKLIKDTQNKINYENFETEIPIRLAFYKDLIQIIDDKFKDLSLKDLSLTDETKKNLKKV
jgi:hypothetical protein